MICRIWSRQPLQKFLCRISQKKLKRRGYSKLEFCDFALWNSDCNLASSFSSKVVLSGRMERLAQRNKIKLKIAPSFQFFLRNPAQKLLQCLSTPSKFYKCVEKDLRMRTEKIEILEDYFSKRLTLEAIYQSF